MNVIHIFKKPNCYCSDINLHQEEFKIPKIGEHVSIETEFDSLRGIVKEIEHRFNLKSNTQVVSIILE